MKLDKMKECYYDFEKTMEYEEEQILKRWQQPIICGILKDVPPERQKSVAVALEQQRLLNERWDSDPQFMRISIPMVRRIMDMPELTSKRRTSANANTSSLCFMKHSIADKFRLAMMQHSLDEEADYTARMVEGLKLEIKAFMENSGKTSMVFLGLILDDNGFLCYFYDWV